MRAKTPATLSAFFFRKLIFSKKFARPCPPPLDPPPWTPPHGPPIFFNFFFQFWTTGAPFYIFFFYYITVFLFIFSLFLFTFFSIIECRAVVLQPPQYTYSSVQPLLPPPHLQVLHFVRFWKYFGWDCFSTQSFRIRGPFHSWAPVSYVNWGKTAKKSIFVVISFFDPYLDRGGRGSLE